ncbi:MAG TPA: hypothetical protein VIG41_03985 [Micrococcaceae bacterium]
MIFGRRAALGVCTPAAPVTAATAAANDAVARAKDPLKDRS